ncbi:hypothetical protein FRP1_16525 [Pseudonocardia sp. EC080625-04]|nr:hypothetical protein FRP1_16525 [Pseudonocardia sp. EC080625-04]
MALQVHAEHPQLAQLDRELAHRQLAGLEPAGHVRPEPLVAEPADGVADRALLLAEQGVEVEQVQGAGRGGHGVLRGVTCRASSTSSVCCPSRGGAVRTAGRVPW